MIGISLLTLVPGIVGGSETYARELVRALARVGRLEYRVFLPTLAADAGSDLPSVVVRAYPARRSTGGRLLAMGSALAFRRRLAGELQLGELAAIHFPLSVMLPRVSSPPAVSTVLDLQHEELPQFFSRAELAYRRAAYGWTIRRSRLIVAISEHVKTSIVGRYGVDPARVRVIHLGVDLARFTPGREPREPFLLYPANRWPHKNHERLFEALALVRRRRPDVRLVLTGSGHEGKPVPPGVEVRGRVSGDELVELYQRAWALVFPSLYEGFGQPPIEAMACGCPVAAAATTSLPEVCGDAARYFDPRSAEAMAEAVLAVLDDPGELQARGLERARGFGWDACARRHDDVYEELSAA